MSLPREIIPGAMYMLTRRCAQRMFLLRPDDETKQIFDYCLAVAAKRCDIGIVAWVVMSNHYHAIIYDPDGRVSEFIAYFHKLVAKVMNRRWKRWENFWSSEEACVTRLVTLKDVFDKIIYTFANPLKANIADRVEDWYGSTSWSFLDGKTQTITRPEHYFSAMGVMVPTETLSIIRPPMLPASETWARWVASIKKAVEEQEITARAERKRQRISVAKKGDVLKIKPTWAPRRATDHRKLRPAIACHNEARRIIEIEKLIEFRIAHKDARKAFCKGDRTVKFPAGTYQARRLGVRCKRHRALYFSSECDARDEKRYFELKTTSS